MKKPILIVLGILLLVGGGFLWHKFHPDADDKPAAQKTAEQKPADDEAGPAIEHDTNGNVVIRMDDEMQGNIGIKVSTPSAARMSPEVKGFGRVMDPSPLAALLTELATAQAAYMASSNELARQKTLTSQGNTSARLLESAEAAALRDRLAVQSVKDRLALAWGEVVANQPDLPAFIQSLATLTNALVRIDLPPGETVPAKPTGVRITTVSGKSAAGEFLANAPNVDPQFQGRGFVFLVRSNNAAGLLPNEAVTGYVKLPGDPVPGVIILRDSVVRTEGSAWIYVMTSQGDTEILTRTKIPLDHPVDNGWFITNCVTPTNYVVVTGAQTLLSQELKASLKPD